MLSREGKDKLFNKLVKIKDSINEQFVHVPNRFAEYECFPLDPNLDDKSKQALIDARYKKYKENESRFNAVQMTNQIYLQLNQFYAEYVNEGRNPTITELEPALLRQAKIIFSKLQHLKKYRPELDLPELSTIEKNLQNNSAVLAKKLIEEGRLTLDGDNQDFVERMNLADQLSEFRQINEPRVSRNLDELQLFDEKIKDQLNKFTFLTRGLFLKKENSRIGLCDEHVSLAVSEIIESCLHEGDEITVEVVGIHCVDENGNRVNGHYFLAINRDPDSQLNDIASWGPKAILFDAWNKLVCYADDYKSLPLHYFTFPSNASATWKIPARFDKGDMDITRMMTTRDYLYYISGNHKIEKRAPLIMDEYQLIPLNQATNKHTTDFLYQLSRDMRPANVNFEPELFLTTDDGELIQVIPGFDEPKIAIHKDFIRCTKEEMAFGIAQIKVKIQHHWVNMLNDSGLSNEEQFKLNRLAVRINQNGSAAIGFLRKCVEFRNSGNHADQIKSLMTLFALDEYHYLNTKEKETRQTQISDHIKQEMKGVVGHVFFEEEFKQYANNIERINYLISCLPELRKELLPYEFYNRPSKRLKDFCHLLRSMNINFNDESEYSALSELVNRAHDLRLPGFMEIYFAIHNDYVSPSYSPSKLKGIFYPLGPFIMMQDEITKFVEASNADAAEKAALNIRKLQKDLICHFDNHPNGYEHLLRYKEEHQGRLPTGADRLFGSSIGCRINWKGFVVDHEDPLPWRRHIAYGKSNPVITETLYDFGIRNDPALFDILPRNILLRYGVDKSLVEVRGRLKAKFSKSDDRDEQYKRFYTTLAHISQKHRLRTEMFDEEPDFRIAFNRFYDENWQMLAYPNASESHDTYPVNHDNNAVRYLLEKFGEIALYGTESDKQVVKDFFTAPKTQRGVRQLMQLEGPAGNFHLEPDSPYFSFLLNQTHQGNKFVLFTPQELLDLFQSKGVGGSRFATYHFPLLTYLKIYSLPFESLSIECLVALFEIDKKKEAMFILGLFITDFFNNNKPQAMSIDMMKLIPMLEPSNWYQISKRLQWDLPDSASQANNLDLKEVIKLYRCYDNHFAFPNWDTKKSFSQWLLKEIMLQNDIRKQIEMLELLLFQDEFFIPLTDIQLRSLAVQQWVDHIITLHGKDNGSMEYQASILPIIKRVLKFVSMRDTITMLNNLATTIEAQWEISKFLGEELEFEKYLEIDKKDKLKKITQLSSASKYFSESLDDQREFLDFMSAPLSDQSLNKFSEYITTHKNVMEFFFEMGTIAIPNIREDLRGILILLHLQFWDLSLEERAVIIDYVIIPSSKTQTDQLLQESYQQGFDYIAKKLFPEAEDPDSDDNFAYALMKAYLNTADKHLRPILLCGMLISSNEASQSDKPLSAGKKIAMMCEHMGPAYIKLAQAIHSHPNTPEHIRRDLDHIKGKAHPPYRWQLWRLAHEVLPEAEFERIKRIGCLIGSASYNVVPAVELSSPDDEPNQNQQVVLALLRENAERDAKKGFKHLRATMLACDHPRMKSNLEAVLATLDEAELLSSNEMNKDKSEQQFCIAEEVYKNIEIKNNQFTVTIKPVKLLSNGNGYRFIERVYGEEFNNLHTATTYDKQVRLAIASSIMEVELVNILSGRYFDSDRHGNQLRALIDGNSIKIGLYDFGEMSLELPTQNEINQVSNLLYDLPNHFKKSQPFGEIVEQLLSEQINKAKSKNEPTSYLMRIRKACLALQDFQKELSKDQLIAILKKVMLNGRVHPEFRKAMLSGASTLAYQSVTDGVFGFFSRVGTQLGITSPATPTVPSQTPPVAPPPFT